MSDNVREAAVEDVPALLTLARAMHTESSRYSRYPFDEEKTRELITNLITRTEACCIFITEREGTIRGMLWGYLNTLFFSQVGIAQDLLCYIRPENRGSSDAKKLIQVFQQWGIDHGVAEIDGGVSSGINNDQAVRFYKHMGFEETGTVLTYYV